MNLHPSCLIRAGLNYEHLQDKIHEGAAVPETAVDDMQRSLKSTAEEIPWTCGPLCENWRVCWGDAVHLTTMEIKNG